MNEWKDRKELKEVMTDGRAITCSVLPMGKDLNVAVYGGDVPHVGSVVVSFARESLTGEGTGVSSSVINGIGHKEEGIARMFAEELARKRRCTVVCACGIHIDGISGEEIRQVQESSRKLLDKLLDKNR